MEPAWQTSQPQRRTTTNGARTDAPTSSGSKLIQLQRANSANGAMPTMNNGSPAFASVAAAASSAGAGQGGFGGAGGAAAVVLPPTPSTGEIHPLRLNWAFWCMHRPVGSKITDYESAMKKIGAFASVEDFWGIYCHLRHPDDLPNVSDYHLFKSGVRPVWEDKENVNGGKWIVRLKKGLASRFWEYLVMAVIGDQFDVGDEICGIVLSIRNSEDILSLWNRTASDGRINMKIRDTMKRVLDLPVDTAMEYKAHNVSINDQSSFRNTDVFR